MSRDFKTDYKWWEDLEKKTKLEQAFAIGCTDKEACSYAEITPDQLYYYTREVNPEFQVKKEELKEKPILKAKQTIVKNLDNPEHAKWYLERKKKDEFSQRQEMTGADGEKLQVIIKTFEGDNLTDAINANSPQLDTGEAPDTDTQE